MSGVNLFSAAGLMYDIAGAWLIVEAIIRTRDEQIARQAHPGGQFSGGNLKLFAALDEQRHDARFGLSLLIVGFLLQLVAALDYKLPLSWLNVAISVVPLLAVVVWWKAWAKRLARSRRDRFAGFHEGMDRVNFLTLGVLLDKPTAPLLSSAASLGRSATDACHQRKSRPPERMVPGCISAFAEALKSLRQG